MEKSDSIKNIAMALNKAQAEMGGAVKDSNNPFFKSSYADLSSVRKAVQEPFANNGLSYAQFPINDDNGRVGVETILMHSSGEFLSNKILVPLSKNDAQGAGSCITYCRRYSLQAIAGIPSEDDDGNAASPQQQQQANNNQGDKQWYNTFDADKPAITNAILSGQQTAEQVINQLSQTYKVNNKIRDAIKEIK